MKYFFKLHALFLLLIIIGLVSNSVQTKKVNCRKYVYAPVCRGVAAKRALPKLPNSIREPRGFATVLDLDTPAEWKDKDKGSNEKGLLHIIFQKLDSKPVDYESETIENDLN
ncbi:hypothetical protein ILUMI_24440 [Ignelater luminosus]|uniref:Elevenin n=1 Tax=Ignelater luminosus TaxID=2038154 RepID=A0A8K0G0W7_IGNLU|nr:hypothetical protein ILUMI_24440 [Ignelater luminosus]